VSGYAVSTVSDLVRPDGWAPIRRHFGVSSFGVNAWTAAAPGDRIIGEHDETGGRGDEELYLVTQGSAVFTVDGNEIDAPAGTLVYVADPALLRGAVAREAPATIVSMGGTPGKTYTPRAWETNRDVFPLFERGDFAAAKQVLERFLVEYPDDQPLVLYNLACAEAQLGEADAALDHLAEAVVGNPQFAEYAREDDDLAPIRDDPRFPS
jgi:hypothetical protein